MIGFLRKSPSHVEIRRDSGAYPWIRVEFVSFHAGVLVVRGMFGPMVLTDTGYKTGKRPRFKWRRAKAKPVAYLVRGDRLRSDDAKARNVR